MKFIYAIALLCVLVPTAQSRGALDDRPKPDAPATGLIGVVDLPRGLQIRLYAEAGPVCVAGAHHAEYSVSDKMVRGCWAVQPQGVVSAGFLDGATAVIPLHAIKQPTSL